MSCFNLIDEHWIPVRMLDGTREEMGLKAVFAHSKEITEIEDQSPLVVAGLYRLLLAILYRALEGPTDFGEAKKLFKTGLPVKKIAGYLEKWRDRFWLFDQKYPFYQIAKYEPKQWRTWPAIAAEHNADNAKVLFDHIMINHAGEITSGLATRWLLACQTFALGGGNSDFKYTKSGPSATAVMVIPLGNNLEDTLVYSLVPENQDILEIDLPVWEREPEKITFLQEGKEKSVNGIANLYTWLTRSVRLNQADDGKMVGELALASGTGCSSENICDPMLAYKTDEKKGRLPIQFRERGLWRDFDSLLPGDSEHSPKIMEHSAKLSAMDTTRFPHAISALGQANDKAKIEYWRMETFALPKSFDGDIRAEIRMRLEEAEEAQKYLWVSCRNFARSVIARGEHEPDKKNISDFMKQMTASARYWSVLELRFHELLNMFAQNQDSDEIRCQWLKFIREALQVAWDQQRKSILTGDVWAIRALAKSESAVINKLKELASEIEKIILESGIRRSI